MSPTKILVYNKKIKVTVLRRRRIHTEERAKVVSAAWGAEFIQFLAILY